MYNKTPFSAFFGKAKADSSRGNAAKQITRARLRPGLKANFSRIVTAAVAAAFVLNISLDLTGSALATEPATQQTDKSHTDGSVFVTLGTAGGPVIYHDRSQPANLLRIGDKRFLVDVGAGALDRLAAIGFQPRDIDGVFISHLHLDHIGGLQALIGIRWMLQSPEPVSIYGPPGTREVVDGIIQSLKPSARIGFGFGRAPPDPAASVIVTELHDGETVELAGATIKTAANSHFVPVEVDGVEPTLSLSYRFDLADRSIGFTGDTGPSDNLVDLFNGVDVLICEVIDLESVVGDLKRTQPQLTDDGLANLRKHLSKHHLTPEDAGALAARASIGKIVFTHLAIVGDTKDIAPKLINGAKTHFDGAVYVANDLDEF